GMGKLQYPAGLRVHILSGVLVDLRLRRIGHSARRRREQNNAKGKPPQNAAEEHFQHPPPPPLTGAKTPPENA
ncbi:MAG: hypothetical protein ACR2QC_03350, partial [Gammaproteobacteria bacterium]